MLLVSSQRFENIIAQWDSMPFVLTPSGSSSMSILSPEDPLLDEWDPHASMRVTQALSSPIMPFEAPHLLFSWNVSFPYQMARCKISFLVDTVQYQSNASAQAGQIPVTNAIYYKGELLYSSNGQADFLPVEQIEAWQDLPASTSQILDIDRESTLICATPTAHSDFLLVSLTPTSYAMSIAGSLQRELMFYNIICLLVAALVLYVILKMNYTPLRRLLNSVNDGLANPSARKNEISSIQDAVDTLKSSNARLRSMNQQTTVNHLMSGLLNGVYSAQNPLAPETLRGLLPKSSGYVLIIVKVFDTHKQQLTSAALVPCIQDYFDDFIIREGAEPVILAGVPTETDLPERLEGIRQSISSIWESPVSLSAGQMFHDIYDCPAAYSEALYAMEYRFVRGNNSLLFAAEMSSQDDWLDHYPRQDLSMLRRMLNTRNLSTLEQISEQFDSIVEYIRASEVPLFAARMICFDIVGIVLDAMSDEERQHNRVHLSRLFGFETVDEMLTAISQLCHSLFALTEPDAADMSRDLTSQMLLYMECNYTDSSFSLREMADYFHMSMANLSQFFKRKTGQTLINYYTNLRMEYAKSLIRDGYYSIEEVSEKVGYLSTSSFIRRFKQFTAASPSRWQSQDLNDTQP